MLREINVKRYKNTETSDFLICNESEFVPARCKGRVADSC